jgi:hypothetical protein
VLVVHDSTAKRPRWYWPILESAARMLESNGVRVRLCEGVSEKKRESACMSYFVCVREKERDSTARMLESNGVCV